MIHRASLLTTLLCVGVLVAFTGCSSICYNTTYIPFDIVGEANGVLVVFNQSHTLFGLNPSDGSQIWQAPDSSFTNPVLANGVVYVLQSDAPGLVALKVSDGTTLWRATVQSNDGTAVVDNNTVYSYDTQGPYALRASDGSVIWHATQSIGIISAIDGQVYALDRGKMLYAFKASDGTPLWQTPTMATNYMPPMGSGVVVDITTSAVVALRTSDGKQLWQYPLPANATFANVDGLTNGLLILHVATQLVALHTTDGSLAWQQTISENSATFSGNVVYLVDRSGIVAEHASDSTVIWRNPNLAGYIPMAFTDTTAYGIATDRSFFAMRLTDGALLWTSVKKLPASTGFTLGSDHLDFSETGSICGDAHVAPLLTSIALADGSLSWEINVYGQP